MDDDLWIIIGHERFPVGVRGFDKCETTTFVRVSLVKFRPFYASAMIFSEVI